MTIARKCVPFPPFDKELSSAVVTIASATGVHLPDQDPFPEEDPGDTTYRVIPGDTDISQVCLKHHHYDHSEADSDPNIVFPLASLQELVRDGFIGAVNDRHYSYGFTTKLKELYEQTFPDIADKIERSRTKLVLLTAGCPETCHRTITNLARDGPPPHRPRHARFERARRRPRAEPGRDDVTETCCGHQ